MVSSILVTGRDRSFLGKHYIPALRLGGWDRDITIVTPGEGLPDLDGVAALFLTGGDDIHPSNWDPLEPVHPLAQVDRERDALEIPLVRQIWSRGLPMFGICRGEQVLNVALGGSLFQDIASRFACEAEWHRTGHADLPRTSHAVRLAEESRLARIIGRTDLEVNSRHHQAVDRIAPGLKAVGWATAPEALVEAVESEETGRWILGVQWHPENLVGLSEPAGQAALRIFQAFNDAARTRC